MNTSEIEKISKELNSANQMIRDFIDIDTTDNIGHEDKYNLCLNLKNSIDDISVKISNELKISGFILQKK